ESAIDLLAAGDAAEDPSEHAALLDLAARLAHRSGLHDRAHEARLRIIEEYPASREAPAALLGLARQLMARNAPAQEIQSLLERLILEHPRSALVPQARRALDELRGRVPPRGSKVGG